MIKIDLHTHSIASHDGGLDEADYKKILSQEKVDAFAVTDHQDISYAIKLSKLTELKDRLIVGQEIKTTRGEIIGLYLSQQVADGKSPRETVDQIKLQKGFVIIPHPLDKLRSGMSFEDMDQIVEDIDAIEVFNGRAVSKPSTELRHWAKQNGCAMLASSDAHSLSGAGRTYTLIDSMPNSSQELRNILSYNIKQIYERPPLKAYLAPKLNRLRNRRP